MQKDSNTTERIIGIDPGVERCGVGIIEIQNAKPKLLFVDCIITEKERAHSERIAEIARTLKAIIDTYKPTRASVEKLFFSQNVKTAMAVSEARGVILATIHEAGLPVTEWTPQQIKQNVTGYGNADKLQVQKLVASILQLKELPTPDDAADALAVALTAQFQPHIS